MSLTVPYSRTDLFCIFEVDAVPLDRSLLLITYDPLQRIHGPNGGRKKGLISATWRLGEQEIPFELEEHVLGQNAYSNQ